MLLPKDLPDVPQRSGGGSNGESQRRRSGSSEGGGGGAGKVVDIRWTESWVAERSERLTSWPI